MRSGALLVLSCCGGCFAIDWDYQSDARERRSDSSRGCDGGSCPVDTCDGGSCPVDAAVDACEPEQEVCNAVDDDCDGDVDEDCPCELGESRSCYSGPPSTQGVGLCKDGLQTCDDGSWSECQGDVGPGVESCNQKDDDCDGDVDEVDDLGTVTCGIGECAVVAPSCGAECTPAAPQPEACDGKDNDCDGLVDDGNPGGGGTCATGQPGVCSLGVQACTAGAISCVAVTSPQAETCGDGEDDDCDGQVDEGCCTNVAPLATPMTSGGGAEPSYGPSRLNNGVGQVCSEWSWVENTSTTAGAFFQYTWSSPQTIGSFHVDGDQASAPACGSFPRDIKSAKVQYWNGAGWVTAGTLSNKGDYLFDFNPPVSTVAIRLFDVVSSAGGGDSVIYEWKVYGSSGCGP